MRASCTLLLSIAATSASAQDLLWDNAIFGQCGSAVSSERDTLISEAMTIDDFLVASPGAIISEVRGNFLVDPPDGSDEPPGGFTASDARFYPVNGSTGGPDCNNPFATISDRPFDVVQTGFDGFGLYGWLVRIDGIDLALPEGHYFLGARPVDTGAGRAFLRNSRCRDDVVLSQSYFHSSYFGTDCIEGIEVKGLPYDSAFQVFGFTPDTPTDAYFHRITLIRAHGDVQGGRDEIAESDDEHLGLTAAHGASLSRYHTASVLFESTFPTKPLRRMDVRVESGTTKPRVTQEIRLLDFDTGRYLTLDARPLPLDDTVVVIEDLPDPGRFIGPDGGVELVVEAYAPGQSIAPHELRIDEVKLVLTYEPF